MSYNQTYEFHVDIQLREKKLFQCVLKSSWLFMYKNQHPMGMFWRSDSTHNDRSPRSLTSMKHYFNRTSTFSMFMCPTLKNRIPKDNMLFTAHKR